MGSDGSPAGAAQIGTRAGPYDIGDLVDDSGLDNSHLDLGSVLVPVVEGGQVTVEMSADHQPQAVYLITPHGRISVAAFAAPRTPGTWREVVTELADSLRADGATASVADGHWGREVVGEAAGAVHRFIGADGPRWMVRCVASGPPETADDLALMARAVLSESVVRRGDEPYPPREPLPVVLPTVLAEQVAAAQQQMIADGVVGGEIADGEIADGEIADGGDVRPDVSSDGPPAGAPDAGGAIAQSAQAQVISEDDLAGSGLDDPGPAEAADSAVDDGPTDAEPEPPRSAGSALQRLRRRKR